MTLSDCLIVVAHPDELNEDLKNLGDYLLLTGVGKINASYNLTRKLTELKHAGKKPKLVINLGSAGSKKYPKGRLVSCSEFIQHDMDCTAFGYEKSLTPGDSSVILKHPQITSDLPKGVCGTGDCFITTQQLDKRIDVVDMEAYALAKVCKNEAIDFIAIKYITDGLDETGGEDWKAEVKGSAESFYDYLQSFFGKSE